VAASESAQNLQRAGKLLEARAALTTCVATSCPAPVRKDCGELLEENQRQAPSLVFEVQDAAANDLGSVRVTMDGKSLVDRIDGTPVAVDPGEHHLLFEAEGFPRARRSGACTSSSSLARPSRR
jgi:hypothetical protein